MKFLSLFRHPAILLSVLIVGLSSLSSSAFDEKYYSAMDGKKKETLKSAAKSCVQKHTKLDYYNLPYQWQYSDVYPELYNGCKRWWEMYSNEIYLIEPGQTALKSYQVNKMQREHSVPKSWWKKGSDVEYTPAYSDMWNLYPSDGPANQAKSNYPLGVVGSASFDNGSAKVGGAAQGTGGGAGKVFEPADEYKGDFARSFFYMATVYDDLPWVVNYMFQQETWPTLRPWAYDMLLQWARKDPVSQKEIIRNDAVEKSQGNRNPFVDFPELAEYIWGTRTSETFYIKEQGGAVTPPIDGDPELLSPVNGTAIDFGQAVVGGSATAYVEISGKNFKAPLSVRVSGSAKSMFTPESSQIMASVINSSEKYLFPVVFSPSAEGVQEASLLLYDGGLEGSVTVTLRGEGCPRPQLSTLTALDPSDITDSGYTANWTPAPETVDYYVVTRTRYLPAGTESETLESAENSLAITERDPAVMESYSVQSSRLGVLSEPSNTVIVASSGVNAVSGTGTLTLGVIDGGFAVVSNPENAPVTVYDTTGRAVFSENAAAEGMEIILPRGIYVIVSPALTKPLKLIN